MTADTANRQMADSLDRIWESVDAVLTDLDPEALTWRPDPSANSISWLIWHLTRVIDDHLAGLARELERAATEQVWTAGGWYARSGLPFGAEAHGYGQPSADVAAVRLDADFLRGYSDAVHTRALALVADLDADDYASIVDTRFTPPVSAGVRLVSLINDATQHVGQAAYLRGMWERRSGA